MEKKVAEAELEDRFKRDDCDGSEPVETKFRLPAH